MFGKEFGRIEDDEDLADFDFEAAIAKQFSTSFLNPDDFSDPNQQGQHADVEEDGESVPALQKNDDASRYSMKKRSAASSSLTVKGAASASSFGEGEGRADIAWTVFWILNLLANISLLIAGYATQPHDGDDSHWWTNSTTQQPKGFWQQYWPDIIVTLLAGIGLPLVLVVGALLVMKSRATPSLFIKPPAYLLILCSLILTIALLSELAWFWAAFWTAVAVCAALASWQLRSRARFTSYLMDLQANFFNMFPDTLYLAFALCIVQLVFGILCGLTIFATGHWGWYTIPYILFSYYWCTQVVVDFLYTAACTTTYSWYISGPPSDITGSSWQITFAVIKRVLSRSFGPICFAALCTPPVQIVVRPLLDFWHPSSRHSAARALLTFANTVFHRCNRFAHVNIGTKGESFLNASRNIFGSFEHQGFDRLLSEESVWMVSTALCTLIGTFSFILAGALSFLIGLAVKEQLQDAVFVAMIVASFCFLLGFRFAGLASALIESGVAMLFASFVDDPAQLRATDSNVFQRLSIEFAYRCPALFAADEVSGLEFAIG